MTMRSRGGVVGAVAVGLLALAAIAPAAQESRKRGASPKPGTPPRGQATAEPKGTAPEPRKGPDQVRRVPPYFAQLKLTDQQREAIYKVRARHLSRIEALEKQLDDERAQLMTESEAVLTPAQKQQLAQLRDSSKGRHSVAEPADEPARPAPAPTKPAREPAKTKKAAR